MRSVLVALACAWLPVAALAEGAGKVDEGGKADDEQAALFERLNAREQILDAQNQTARAATRRRVLFLYRIARYRELGFARDPETRLDNARAFDLAMVALRRSLDEASALGRELDRVRGERSSLEAALIEQALAKTDRESRDEPDARPRLTRPLRGTPVSFPGARRDGPTKVELRHDEVEILAKLNDPVRAVAAGTVRRVEALPQGGFAVVTEHREGFTSIVAGLRDIAVTSGEEVSAGQVLGLVGRNLDGAAVLSVEIWRHRRAQDASRWLRLRKG